MKLRSLFLGSCTYSTLAMMAPDVGSGSGGDADPTPILTEEEQVMYDQLSPEEQAEYMRRRNDTSGDASGQTNDTPDVGGVQVPDDGANPVKEPADDPVETGTEAADRAQDVDSPLSEEEVKNKIDGGAGSDPATGEIPKAE